MTGAEALWVGVDVGTQSIKAAVIGADGRVHATASSALRSIRESHPDGDRHEQHPDEWMSATRDALTSVMRGIPSADRARIGGVAVCATSGSICVVDGGGNPVSTGIMYDDARAGSVAEEVARAAPDLWKRLGYRIQPTWALPKIVWLARRGDLTPGDRFLAHQADVVTASLVGGRVASDWSHALKSGYDLLSRTWPDAALRRLGVDAASLPVVVAPGTVLGRIDEATAAVTGLPPSTPVFAGMTDGCAAQLGAAAVGLGDCHTVIGTTMVIKSVSSKLVSDDAGAVYSHLAPEGTRWLPGGASSVGAGIIASRFAGADLDELTTAVEKRYANRSAMLPFSYPLQGVGERFPVVAPSARGFIVAHGHEFPLSTAPGELDETDTYAALLVGVACVERLAIEQLSPSEGGAVGSLSSSGGGTKNTWWVQLRSDLLGRPIAVSSTADGATGMAILAAWAAQSQKASALSLAVVAGRMSHADRVYRPEPMRAEQLDQVYRAFRSHLSGKGWFTP